MLFFIIRKKQIFVKTALILLFLFSNGIVSGILWRFLEHPWKRLEYDILKNADGIVVLSGGRHLPPGNSKIIEWNDPDRFIAGVNLFKAQKSNRLIFTGGLNGFSTDLPPEGDIYIEEAISMGIPSRNLYTTYPIYNTFQEAKAVKVLLNQELQSKSKSIILVTSAFHMNRAKKVFEREGFLVQPYPVDFKSRKSFISLLKDPLRWIPNSRYLYRNSAALREFIGRIVYRIW